MTAKVMYVSRDQTIEQCMTLMASDRLRHLPVLDGAKVVGLASIGDLVGGIVKEQEFTISQLAHYISRDM